VSDKSRKLWSDEKELLSRIAERDEYAFRIIFDRYEKRLYTFTLKLLKSEDSATEVLQETFLKIWLLGDRLKDINYLEGFLIKTARNRAIDHIRKTQQQARLRLVHEQQFTEEHNDT
jgi:RNA polymerase sigma-70 factor (ECF subfamily)